MAKKLITPAAILPVTLSEALIHERISVSDAPNNASILGMLAAATSLAEEYTRRAFITQVWELETTQLWPYIEIPRPRLISVDAATVMFFNWNNISTLIPALNYYVDTVYEPGRLVFKAGYFPFPLGVGFPTGYGWGYGSGINGVDYGPGPGGYLKFRFTAGYGPLASDVPWAIKEAILQIFGSLYQNRESQGIDCGAKQLLDAYKVEYL